ncbi:PPK2 family polyphosphate:nucleotide phosphotransferase [Deinococcus metalli]|uniref:PPK2 family polyphosphate:nucleotide phosphotransferase n=1 Tax=Deinococcus metalli TaxID=1141878 RepID=A0A7W8NS19_9DEIO|nr:polyphosphate kinase 2 family protein [Deinococcus metalli]MBB5376702.1 PPK2 family polyphosphate:nucleotide phosphotransferase [Deinococcus metalli]GHF44712.1 polyphosphate kinase [Deinococcus metalli]
MKTDAYRVKEGKKVKLAEWKTDEDGGLEQHDAKVLTKELQEQLAEWQERLYAERKQALLIVLQARDAGGKDGVVKHVVGSFNPNGLTIAPFKVPTEEELAHDFLWRIHAQVPGKGMIGVFNRSHYEDVLVTRVYDMIDDKTAKARLRHIRHFEELLADSGTRILKFYLHISRDEQKRRLQDRLDEPGKHWKFNPGDLKDREHWTQFTAAYQDALGTSTADAPWYVIPADHKWYRDLLISQILLDTLKDMDPKYPKTSFDPAEIRIE